MKIKLTPKDLVIIQERLNIPDDVDAENLYGAIHMICQLSSCFMPWSHIIVNDVLTMIAKKYLYYEKSTLGRIIYFDNGKEEHFTSVSID